VGIKLTEHAKSNDGKVQLKMELDVASKIQMQIMVGKKGRILKKIIEKF
jgi:GTPase Era involved in 16S rRNA processing